MLKGYKLNSEMINEQTTEKRFHKPEQMKYLQS